MRYIKGLAGCQKGAGNAELEANGTVSVRVVDSTDNLVALRIGTHPECARLTPEEARHVSSLLTEAADRVEHKDN